MYYGRPTTYVRPAYGYGGYGYSPHINIVPSYGMHYGGGFHDHGHHGGFGPGGFGGHGGHHGGFHH